jgi:hypothetical protein
LSALALLTAVLFAVATVAQAPQAVPPQQPAAGGPPPEQHRHPAPTNLKVLPKNLTGEQVHEIMEQWEAALGAHCSTCHTPDPNNIGPNGRPRLNFADDSRPEKATARLMYKMTLDINQNYVSMVDSSGAPVTATWGLSPGSRRRKSMTTTTRSTRPPGKSRAWQDNYGGGWPRSQDISKPHMRVPPVPRCSGTVDVKDLNPGPARDAPV